jgi:hypothetical protein
MTYDSMELFNHYRLNIELLQNGHWTQTELDDMIPFERMVYIDLMNHKKKNEK